MLRQYTDALQQSVSDIDRQVREQERELEGEAGEQTREVLETTGSAYEGVRESISGLEKERQDILRAIREVEREEQKKRTIPGYRPVYYGTEEKLSEIESLAGSAFAVTRISKEGIETAEKQALGDISGALSQAKAELQKRRNEAIKEAETYYKAESDKYERENIKLGDDTWVDRNEFNNYFKDIDTEYASKYRNIALSKGVDAMNDAMKQDYQRQVIESTPVIPTQLKPYIDIDTTELNLNKAVLDGLTDAELYKQANYNVSQLDIDNIVNENKRWNDTHVQLSNGDWVDRYKYEQYTPELQTQLNRLGVTVFNDQLAKKQADFESNNIKLLNGDWVSRNDYYNLSVLDRNILQLQGVNMFNAIVDGREREFQFKNVEIKDGVWVDRFEWNKLDDKQKQQVIDTGQYTTDPIVIVNTPKGEKQFKQAEWNRLNDVQQLEVTLGRPSKLSEYEAYRLYNDLVETGILKESDVESYYKANLPFIPTATALGYIEQLVPGTQYYELINDVRNDAAYKWEREYSDMVATGAYERLASGMGLEYFGSDIYNTLKPTVYPRGTMKELGVTAINVGLLTLPLWGKPIGKLAGKVKLIGKKPTTVVETKVPMDGVLPNVKPTVNEVPVTRTQLDQTIDYLTSKDVPITKEWHGLQEFGTQRRWTFAGETTKYEPKQFIDLGKVELPQVRETVTPEFLRTTVPSMKPLGYYGIRSGMTGGAKVPIFTSRPGESFSGGVRTPYTAEMGEGLTRGGTKTPTPQIPVGEISPALIQAGRLNELNVVPVKTGVTPPIGVPIGYREVTPVEFYNEYPDTVESVLSQQLQHLGITSSQLQGVEPLRAEQINAITMTTNLTGSQIQALQSTGQLVSVISQIEPLNLTITTPRITTMPTQAISPEVRGLPESATEITTEVKPSVEISPAVETATQIATETELGTRTDIGRGIETRPPRIIRIVIPDIKEADNYIGSRHTPERGTYLWKMGEPYGGEMWYALKPPYTSVKDFYTIRGTPRGDIKNARGIGSAYKTFQIYGGKWPENPPDVEIDIGAILIGIEDNEILFDRDPEDVYKGKKDTSYLYELTETDTKLPSLENVPVYDFPDTRNEWYESVNKSKKKKSKKRVFDPEKNYYRGHEIMNIGVEGRL